MYYHVHNVLLLHMYVQTLKVRVEKEDCVEKNECIRGEEEEREQLHSIDDYVVLIYYDTKTKEDDDVFKIFQLCIEFN